MSGSMTLGNGMARLMGKVLLPMPCVFAILFFFVGGGTCARVSHSATVRGVSCCAVVNNIGNSVL
jgi:hypothetical protein